MIVWEAFNGKIPGGLCVNHIDCNKTNNSIENLELVTYQQNTHHAAKMGKIKQLNVFQVRKIKKLLLDKDFTYTEIGKMFDVDHSTIRRIYLGKDYKWVDSFTHEIRNGFTK
jgi:hypothetical protein